MHPRMHWGASCPDIYFCDSLFLVVFMEGLTLPDENIGGSPDRKGSFLKTDHKATFKDSWFVIRKQLNHFHWKHISVQSLSRVRLCNPMDRSTPGLPVHHQLPEFTQTHVHWVSDAIQPSHPLSHLPLTNLPLTKTHLPLTNKIILKNTTKLLLITRKSKIISSDSANYHTILVFISHSNKREKEDNRDLFLSGSRCSIPFPLNLHVHVLSRVWLFVTRGRQPTRLLCPWVFLGKNTGAGCHFLLQRIFPNKGSNPRLLHWQVDSLSTEPPRKPFL